MNLDDKIKDALRMDEKEVEKVLRNDNGLFAQLSAVFDGNMKSWNIFGLLLATITAILLFYSGYHFFVSDTQGDRLFWGVILVVTWTGNMGLKIWFWMEMHRNITSREIKRLELAVTQLTAKLEVK